MKPLAKNIISMPRSGIREIMEMAFTLNDVIHLEAGEPNFSTPAHIVDAAIRAARDGFTKYTPNAGLLTLREAIVEKIRREKKIKIDVDNIVVTTGGVGGLTSTIMAIVEAGDEVLVPDPGWPNYISAVRIVGATPIRYPLDPQRGFMPDLDALNGKITDKSKLLIVNSPSNPTGAILSRDVVEDLVSFARRHDLYILSDEVYERIIFDGEHVSFASFDPDGRVIVANSFSKTYAMTGWRVGFVTAREDIAALVTKLQEPLTSCVAGISQKAAEAALLGTQQVVAEMCNSYKERRDLAIDILKTKNLFMYVPQGAFYILVDISKSGKESSIFARDLIERERVAVSPGSAFGEVTKNYIRISLASEKSELREGLNRIGSFIQG